MQKIFHYFTETWWYKSSVLGWRNHLSHSWGGRRCVECRIERDCCSCVACWVCSSTTHPVFLMCSVAMCACRVNLLLPSPQIIHPALSLLLNCFELEFCYWNNLSISSPSILNFLFSFLWCVYTCVCVCVCVCATLSTKVLLLLF